MIDHDKNVLSILSKSSSDGKLRCRESNTVEFKRAYNMGNAAGYAKTMAAFANNMGGYIIFGIEDSPRIIRGLTNENFENLQQEKLTDIINSYFSPAIIWDVGTVQIEVVDTGEDGKTNYITKKIGWIYAEESEAKPVIALKDNASENISSGDIFFRYRARNGKIKSAEMEKIIYDRIARERENLLKVLEVIRKNGTANLGIVNYSNGKMSTPYGFDIAFDKKIVTKVLQKAKFIKEGSFDETDGIPVLKVTGNIDLAEEVPVPEGNPDDTHPYIQKQLAERLGVSQQVVYALVWKYHLKGDRKFHLEISTSKTGKIQKFSKYALSFLDKKINELSQKEIDDIKSEYIKSR